MTYSIAPKPRWVEARNSRTSPAVTASRSASIASIRSGSTGHQSTSERERRSITGPNHIACDRIQGARASRHAARAPSSVAGPGLSQSACKASSSRFIPAAVAWNRGTITVSVRLTRTSCREAGGAAAAQAAPASSPSSAAAMTIIRIRATPEIVRRPPVPHGTYCGTPPAPPAPRHRATGWPRQCCAPARRAAGGYAR